MSGEEERKTRVHSGRPQNQLVPLPGSSVGGAHSPPSFSQDATTKREAAGSEKNLETRVPAIVAEGLYWEQEKKSGARSPIHGSFGISLWGLGGSAAVLGHSDSLS